MSRDNRLSPISWHQPLISVLSGMINSKICLLMIAGDWWINSCDYASNLNGKWYPTETVPAGEPAGIYWRSWKDKSHSLQAVQMMLSRDDWRQLWGKEVLELTFVSFAWPEGLCQELNFVILSKHVTIYFCKLGRMIKGICLPTPNPNTLFERSYWRTRT